MILTTSNILRNVAPTVTQGENQGQTPLFVTNADHSLKYLGSSITQLQFDFGATPSITYVAVSGHNVGDGAANGFIYILDNGVQIDFVELDRNHVCVFEFEPRAFSNLQIRFTSDGVQTATGIICSYVAAGNFLTVPNNGEQAGYSRNYLTRPLEFRSSANSLAGPTSVTGRKMPLKGSLSIPNMSDLFAKQDWQTFFDFIEEQPFFVRENDNSVAEKAVVRRQSSYCCFQPKFIAPKAHAQTRSLVVARIDFMAFNGL